MGFSEVDSRMRKLHPAAAAELGGRIALGVEHLEAARTRRELLDELLRHGNLVFGRLGQRDADGVADTVGQQRADAHGALDAPLEAVARLGHPEMYRVVHPLGIHRLDQQPVGVDHHARIARLHRDNHLVEVAFAADAQELHRRDDHPLRRIAPLVEDAAGERAVVDADAQRYAALAALLDERLELAVLRAVVARVDAHLVDVAGRNGGHLGHEVDVGHQRRVVALGTQLCGDGAQVLAFAAALGRQADNLAPGTVDALNLGHARRRVVGVGIGHRLHGNGIVAADGDPSDAHLAGRTAPVFRKIHRSNS